MNNLIKIILNIINKIFLKEIIDMFINISRLEIKEKLLFLILLPFSIFFVTINFLTFIVSIFIYLFLFIFRLIRNRVFKKKVKNIKCKKRFKFLKNFYLIFIEKVFISYTKQKAFLIFYLIIKGLWEKNYDMINKEVIVYYLKSISNRYLISILLGLPYIVIFVNYNLIEIIKNLKGFNYESKKAYLNTILINILKNLSNNYEKFILKLKIKISKKKIIFNSKVDLLRAMRYKSEFGKNCNQFKKKLVLANIKQVLNRKKLTIEKEWKNKYSKDHPTLILPLKDEETVIYINETSSNNFLYWKYNKEVNNYIQLHYENSCLHKGTINKKKDTFFTPLVVSNKKNMIISENISKNSILSIEESNLDKVIAAFSVNLDKDIFMSYYIEKEKNEIKLNEELKNMKLKKTIEYFKENKDNIETSKFESILGMQFFWDENQKIIENLTTEEKILLCIDLNVSIYTTPKEISFIIFKDIINKNF